jgi:zinc D-Ala-D-Ala carboxypeptidase
MTQLSQSFTLQELVFSQTAARDGIDNTPSVAQVRALRGLCANILQPLRDSVGKPLVVSSGYRCPRLNRAIGGSATSQHMEGRAADIVCFSLDTKKLFKRVLELKLPFDQLIYEGGRQSIWVHVSFDPDRDRRAIMTATFPEAGGVVYEKMSRRAALKF